MSSILNNSENKKVAVFQEGGEMGKLINSYDWDNHPLGSPDHWPHSLKSNINLLLNSRFPMFIWWSEEFYMFHNDAYLPALGRKHPEALGASARVMWAEIWDQLGVIAEGILQNGNPFYAEDLIVLLDRKGYIEETYWTFSYSPVFNDDGKVAGIFCACSEVTKSVLGQRRLKTLNDISESTTSIQSLPEACQVVSQLMVNISSDIPFNLIYILNNSGTEAKLHGMAGDIFKEAAPDIIYPEELSAPWPIAEVKNSGQLLVVDLPDKHEEPNENIKRKPQKKAVILPIFRTGQDHLIGFFISGLSSQLPYDTDYQNFHKLLARQLATVIISVQARVQLTQQKEFLNQIFQQAPVGITILNGPDYVVELANPLMCQLWGRTFAEVINKPVLEALPEVEGQGIRELLDGVLNTGIPYVNNEFCLMLERNGLLEKVYFDFVYHPLRDNEGIIRGIIAVAISINEQVEARQKVESMNRDLIASNADLDNFVYSASHDLKAPISNIEGLLHALFDHLPEEIIHDEVVVHILKHIQGAIERFKKTVADLTDVTKIQREDSNDVSSINLKEVIKEVLLDFELGISEAEAFIKLQVEPELLVQFSAKNIRSVVYNLVSNALKYRSPNRKPEITITTEQTPEYTILAVSDNGLGINLAEETKMFSMFKRLHDHVEGSGIGLYIVKKIIENAGGKIKVESELDKGSTFKVYFKK